jgi:crotonobetainyl-CoA:carnitine CoA-transferase CaiB-like acyl-CoA transferase
VRVLDVTRVIAGPVCTRFLAAYGASVLRVDPPGFEEVPAAVPDTTWGKRRAGLDLSTTGGRHVFRRLVDEADVLVHGLRPGALAGLGLAPDQVATRGDGPVEVTLDAYGWTGPWAGRRGFDSLVQMSTGIAARGAQAAGADRPSPLPVQALDHATGYLLAAAVTRSLVERLAGAGAVRTRASLARTARALVDLGEVGDPDAPAPTPDRAAARRRRLASPWGPVEVVEPPGEVAGWPTVEVLPPGPVVEEPTWPS